VNSAEKLKGKCTLCSESAIEITQVIQAVKLLNRTRKSSTKYVDCSNEHC